MKRLVVPALFLALLIVGGWAVAEQKQSEPQGGALRPNRYTALAAGQTAILLETTTGKTWVMTQGVDGNSAWLPAQRLESEEDARQWLAKERQRVAAVSEVQREMARRLEDQRLMPGPKGPGQPEKEKK